MGFVREFFVQRLEWLKDEPLNLGLPMVPAFDRRLPKPALAQVKASVHPLVTFLTKEGTAAAAAAAEQLPLPSSPVPPARPVVESPVKEPAVENVIPKGKEEAFEPVPEEVKEEAATQEDALPDEDDGPHVEDLVARIRYLEKQLAKRVERSALQLQRLKMEQSKREQTLVAENTLLRSDLSDMNQTLSSVMSESDVSQTIKSMVVLNNFETGDRVAFFKNAESGFYEAINSTHVYLSKDNCEAFASLKLPPSFCGIVVSTHTATSAYKNYFKLREGTEFTELTVELENEVL